jgi:putative transcriptional regulator
VVATPLPGGGHFGFILNRPTKATLGKMFPDHAPSQKVVEPVHLGGPLNLELIFALVQRADPPGGDAVELMPGVYAAFERDTIDRIIETQPERARFVAGLVGWSAGELQQEVKQGVWHVLDADPALVLRKSDGLWEELLRRVESRARGI